MKIILILLINILCFGQRSLADDYHIIDLEEVSLDYKNYSIINANARNLLIYPEPPKEGINVNINTTVFRYLYFNTTIESLTTDSQYRSIGLQLSLGLKMSDYIDIGYYHHSQHVIDRQILSIPNFPFEDALQIKIYLFKKQKQESLL